MIKYIVGIDEVGRGPLAGPVTVAAVAAPILSYKFQISNQFSNIKDSKKLSPKKRQEWYSIIKNNPSLKFSVASVSQSIIDRKGIAYATGLAIKRCLKKLDSCFMIHNSCSKVLLDGSLFAPAGYIQKTIIKGDEKIPIISAASIIAKVTRDRKMARLAKKFPIYNFETHKGYGTKMHRELVKTNGLCELHRRSFCTRLI